VRPEEELAYLAITRPEVDQIVSPEETQPAAGSILDAIPTIPSPSSTRVNSPELSPTIPDTSLPGSPRPGFQRASSVLGKRASTDRDDSSGSSLEHSRLKSEGFEDLGDVTPKDEDKEQDGFEFVSGERQREDVDSPLAVTDLEGLKLKSPELEDPVESSVPPPLPPRPPMVKKDTLASGLRFGLQQDSAEVLINVLTQLELAFDPAVAEEGEEGRTNLISE
jgi:ubiquitin carboxyl-terminal hydrolase 25/28